MKKIPYLLFSVMIWSLFACKKEEKNIDAAKKDGLSLSPKDSMVSPEIHKDLYGLYVGDFMPAEQDDDTYNEPAVKISLKIHRITRDSVYGHSIVKGKQRLFRGIYKDNSQTFILDEPGDDFTDGRFEFKLKDDSLKGNWTAFTPAKVRSPKKKLRLVKKDFMYSPNYMIQENTELVDWENPKIFKEKFIDPDTGKEESYDVDKMRVASEAVFKINASKQKLTEKDIKNLRKLDLQIIKNTIYARHGYAFKKQTYRNFFDTTDWYIPVAEDVSKELTSVEKENITLLDRFIKYAEDKYDTFGR